MNQPAEDERLHAWLRQHAPELPDDGFALRVLAALPPRAASSPRVHPALLATCGGLAGLVFAVLKGARWPDFVRAVEVAGSVWLQLAGAVADPWIWAAVACAGTALLARSFLVRWQTRH